MHTTTAAITTTRQGALRTVAAGPALWRVVDPTGHIVGHLSKVTLAEGVRYRAQRLHAASRAFRALGDFWSVEEAVECLRYSR